MIWDQIIAASSKPDDPWVKYIIGVVVGVPAYFYYRRKYAFYEEHAKYTQTIRVAGEKSKGWIFAAIIVAIAIFYFIFRGSRDETKPNQSAKNSLDTRLETPASQTPTSALVTDPELLRLQAEAQKQYDALTKARAELNVKEGPAVKAFNEKADAYKALNVAIEKRRQELSGSATVTAPQPVPLESAFKK
jgi:hypothetical protein